MTDSQTGATAHDRQGSAPATADAGRRPAGRPLGLLGRTLLGLYLAAMGILLVIAICQVWPPARQLPNGVAAASGSVEEGASQAAAGAEVGGAATPSPPATAGSTAPQATTDKPERVQVLGFALDLTTDLRLIVIVILVAALGSWLHAASSWVAFIGNRKFVASWVWWYLLRPITGSGLGLIFYFALRGGLLSANVDSDYISPYGVAALAGFVGLFTERATKKLKEVFDTLFTTQPEKDPLDREGEPGGHDGGNGGNGRNADGVGGDNGDNGGGAGGGDDSSTADHGAKRGATAAAQA